MRPAQATVAVVFFYSILAVTALVSESVIFYFVRGNAIHFKLIKLVIDAFDFSLLCTSTFNAFYTLSVYFKIALLSSSEVISSELHYLIKQKMPNLDTMQTAVRSVDL